MVLLISVLTGFGGAIAYALWHAEETTHYLKVQEAVLGFAVTKVDPSQNQATEIARQDGRTTPSAGFSVGEEEAVAMLGGQVDTDGNYTIAVPFTVTMMTSAGYSMNYIITLDQDPDPESVLGMDGPPVFFQVDEPDACAVAGQLKHPTDVETLVPGVESTDKLVATGVDYWCMVMSVKPGIYSNTATASGVDYNESSVESTPTSVSKWSAFVLPDPKKQPDFRVTLVPTVTWPSGR